MKQNWQKGFEYRNKRPYTVTSIIAYQLSPDEIPYEVETVATELYVPWAITISEEGTLYFTERSGDIRTIKDGVLQPKPLITFGAPFISPGEGGLLGLVLDPDFLQNRYIYAMHTYSLGDQIYSRVVRLLEQGGTAAIDKVLIDRIPGGQNHFGGRLKIGPDRKLYITTGDAGNPSLAQDLNSLAGKILRVELDGSIPEDNPYQNSPVYSLGHRNSQGLAWNEDNILYSSDHGARAHDEINRIQPGANYGWPIIEGEEVSKEGNLQTPLIQSGEVTWAPSGIAFINQGPWEGKLLVANLLGEQLLAFTLNEDGTEVILEETWFKNEFGRLREVYQAPDGSIYLSTSNRDGRGRPDLSDDRIIRLIPKQQ